MDSKYLWLQNKGYENFSASWMIQDSTVAIGWPTLFTDSDLEQ